MRVLPLLVLLLSVGCAGVASPVIDARVAHITEDGVRAHVDALAAIGPRAGRDRDATERTLRYLTERLQSLGYAVQEERFEAPTQFLEETDDDGVPVVTFSYPVLEHRNLIVEIPGATEPERVLEIGAHYDTVPGTVGADDNSSGVAGLLEIARVLAGTRHERTVRLCFFAMEEEGLHGSRAHVENVLAAESEVDFEGIIVLEMIGYTTSEPDSQQSPVRIPLILYPPTTGDFIAVVGNISSGGLGNLVEDAADRHVPKLSYYSLNRVGGFFGDSARSDHFPYWEAGLHGVMLTDTANFRTPHYHRPSDTPDTLDYAFLRDVARATAAAVMTWARPLPDAAP